MIIGDTCADLSISAFEIAITTTCPSDAITLVEEELNENKTVCWLLVLS